jgi:hypothetical protein
MLSGWAEESSADVPHPSLTQLATSVAEFVIDDSREAEEVASLNIFGQAATVMYQPRPPPCFQASPQRHWQKGGTSSVFTKPELSMSGYEDDEDDDEDGLGCSSTRKNLSRRAWYKR